MRELATEEKHAPIVVTTTWRDFYQLTKPTISLLVVVTAVPTIIMASYGLPSLGLVVATLVGTWMAAASAAVFNHLVEFDTDELMNRTRNRPLPSKKLSQSAAFAFGATLGIAASAILYIFATPAAALISLAANAFYVLFYTLFLKRRTSQNIVIGGAAGAVGPLIGWAAVTGELHYAAWLLFGLIFFWTPPHFWALALKYKEDYARANIPMLPVVKGDAETRKQIFWYSVLLPFLVVALYLSGHAGQVFLWVSMGASLYFSYICYRLWREQDNGTTMQVFHFSCFYLFIVFGSLTIDTLIHYLI